MSDIVERLRAGTAGLTLYEIEALWGEAATALSAVVERRKTTSDRFFIDHGQIHDRATGKHVTTDEDSVFCDGINSALELLNTLNAAATEAADAITTLRAENERMREALEPFADEAPTYDTDDDDLRGGPLISDAMFLRIEEGDGTLTTSIITVGDLRRARAALKDRVKP